jgi:hypothetical protein
MSSGDALCPICGKLRSEEVVMQEKHDMLICPKCRTSFFIKGKIPLHRYFDEWKKNANDLFPLLRPEIHINELPHPQLYFLYEDCYHTLLIGKFNASIVLMGILLEAIMKERIRLKLGKDFVGPYGACLKVIKEKKLMDRNDILFLRRFKDDVRNPYTHVDESQLLQGAFVRVWEIPVAKVLSLAEFEKTLADIKSGKKKPKLMDATNPIVRPIIKREYDRRHAIKLFNQVYDFLVAANIKYFKQKEYDEYNRKFSAP